MSVIESYRRVLANRHLARLLVGEFVSSVGDWLYLVALLIVVYERAGDPVVLGIVGAARVLPYILLSVPAGIAADRFDRRLILLITDVARGAIMVVMAVVVAAGGPVEAIVALAIAATCFSAFFSPAIGSYIPALVRDEAELGPANSTWSTLDNLAFIIGPAIAGLLIALGGLVPAFLLNAATFAVIAVVLWRLPPSHAEPHKGDVHAITHAAVDGPARDRRQALSVRKALQPIAMPLIAINVVNIVGAFVSGGLGVLTVVIAVDVLRSGDTGTGLLNAAVGIGGLVGGILSGILVLRRRLAPPMVVGGLAAGISVVVLGQAGSLPVSMAAIGVGSLGGLLVDVVATTLFQRIVPDNVRGRTIGLMETLGVASYAAGSFTLPILASAAGLAAVLAASGAALVASVVIAVPLLGDWAVQVPPRDAARARLARVPMLAGLPPASLERAISRSSVVEESAGGTIIREGEPADLFYVIVEGAVEVSQIEENGERRVLRRLGRDDVFGEIGLLTGKPRSATVTAVEPTRLICLGGADFLELVASGPGVISRLLALHRGAIPLETTGG